MLLKVTEAIGADEQTGRDTIGLQWRPGEAETSVSVCVMRGCGVDGCVQLP